jgi:hypothetical protein
VNRSMLMLLLAGAGALLAGCGAAFESNLASRGDPEVFEGPVPAAVCGEGSNPETGLQGQVPKEDVASGRAAQGYSCNIEILGHEGAAANLTLAYYDHCAYYSIGDAQGVAVVDLSDPASPVRTATLMTPAMANPLESLRVNDARGLMAAVQGPSSPGFLDVYDLTGDCANPALGSVKPVNVVGHEAAWAPDGLTYYATTTYGLDAITAIDMTDPASPAPVTFNGTQNSHGLSISNDGNRAYVTDQKISSNQAGVTILDTTQVQKHVFDAPMPAISSITWDDGGTGQHTIPITIKGRPYLVNVDEGGYGAARLIDIADETRPIVVSKLRLEIHMPENRVAAQADGAGGFLAYDGHFCNVPQRDDPELLLCGYTWSGFRAFDIRDPLHPREIAYFNPAAGAGRGTTGDLSPPQFDAARGLVIFTIGGGAASGPAAGMYVARFTNGVWPFK